ncbi:MAG: peptidase S8 [Actinobacteria bacterium]|nr:MAG: peptidase S8 [Actinomycetota bacterium]
MFRSLGSALAACVLLLLSPGGGSASPAGTRIVVGYTAEGYSGARALEREFGAEVIGRIGALRADVLRLGGGEPDGVLALLRADPRVRYAELDEVVRALRVPNDEFLPRQWSVTKTHAEQAWDLSTGSSQVVVGILDTGIDPAQPDLRGKLVAGYDYVNNDQDPSDDNGHGTAVAGIVAADSDNGIGVAGYCWACRLMPVKVLGADGTGFVSGLAQGIVWAADHGARVINASLGSPVDDLTLTSAVQYAWLRGVLVVAAAGNESSPVLDYPAGLPNVLSVSASDQNDRLYGFSNSGARVAAPGENSTTGRGDSYVSFLGTSSAAPVVSGIAGLAFSLVPGATSGQVEQAIETGAVPIPGVASGRVDAFATLHTLAPALAPTGTPAAPGQARQEAGGSGTRAGGTRTKVVTGRLRQGRNASVVLATGAGLLRATAKARTGRATIRLRLLAAGRVAASARGAGRASLRAQVRARTYRLVVSTTSRKPLAFALTISYPAASS